LSFHDSWIAQRNALSFSTLDIGSLSNSWDSPADIGLKMRPVTSPASSELPSITFSHTGLFGRDDDDPLTIGSTVSTSFLPSRTTIGVTSAGLTGAELCKPAVLGDRKSQVDTFGAYSLDYSGPNYTTLTFEANLTFSTSTSFKLPDESTDQDSNLGSYPKSVISVRGCGCSSLAEGLCL